MGEHAGVEPVRGGRGVAMATTNTEIRAAALELAQLGLAAIPLSPERKPILKGWPNATSSPVETAARFTARCASGLAIVVAPPLFVIDLDRGHVDGVDGIAAFGDLVRQHGADFPRGGPRTFSRRGGVHIYLRARNGLAIRSSASVIGPGIDCKGARSCVTAPPTLGYRWMTRPCAVDEIPVAPDWLIQLLTPTSNPPASRMIETQSYTGNTSAYARAALERELTAVATSRPGERNSTLFKASAALGALHAGGALPGEQIARGLLAAATACGLRRDDGAQSVEATIASGIRVGSRTPRAPRSTTVAP